MTISISNEAYIKEIYVETENWKKKERLKETKIMGRQTDVVSYKADIQWS